MGSDGTAPAPAGRRLTKLMTAVVVIGLIGLLAWVAVIHRRQSRCLQLMDKLRGDAWEEAAVEIKELGILPMPYLSRVFFYDEEPQVRLRAGEVILDLIIQEKKSVSPPDLEKWQNRARDYASSELLSKTLRDEYPPVRAMAAKIAEEIGTEGDFQVKRLAVRNEAEKLLQDLRTAEGETLEAAKRALRAEGMSEFAMPMLVGVMALEDEPRQARETAAQIIYDLLKGEYIASPRSELASFIGIRRAGVMVSLLISDVPFVAETLSLSPHIERVKIDAMRAALSKATAPEDRKLLVEKYRDWIVDVEAGGRQIPLEIEQAAAGGGGSKGSHSH